MRKTKLKSLSDLIKHITILDKIGDLDCNIGGLSYDSRAVQSGDIFCCIKGFEFDGHSFAIDAIKKGANALLVERVVENTHIPQIVVSDSRKTMGELAASLFNNPSNDLRLVGVTGTNGKSTTVALLAGIAKAAGEKSGTIGTLGLTINGKKEIISRTTPESPEIQKKLREMVDRSVMFCAMEISSHAIDLKRYVGLKFDALIFTNLTQDHLDYHKSMDDYFNVKAELFRDKNIRKKQCELLSNVDDIYGNKLARSDPDNFKTYSISDNADFTARVNNSNIHGSNVTFVKSNTKKGTDININLPGKFNIYNALSAFAAMDMMGYPAEVISNGISSVNSVEGRFEKYTSSDGINIVIDYAHTPDGLKSIISEVRKITDGKVITIFGCGGDRDRGKRPIMGKISSILSDTTIVTTDNPRSEEPLEIMREVCSGMDDRQNVIQIIDREEAIKEGISIAKKDDTIIIAGKGHENYQEIKGKKFPFSDKAIVEKILFNGRGLGE